MHIHTIKVALYSTLQERYALMVRGSVVEDRVNSMMNHVVLNCLTWPNDKIGRWVGYAQCLLIEVANVTTIKAERDFTRPLFHKLYEEEHITIPDSVEVILKP